MEETKVIEIDWKAPSNKKIKEVVEKLDNAKKKDFAVNCISQVEGKFKMDKTKAKDWLNMNCKGMFEWKNAPTNTRPMSSVDEMAKWLDL